MSKILKTSMEIENEIRAMEKKILQYKEELESVRVQEYKVALDAFIERFALKTTEAVREASDVLESAGLGNGDVLKADAPRRGTPKAEPVVKTVVRPAEKPVVRKSEELVKPAKKEAAPVMKEPAPEVQTPVPAAVPEEPAEQEDSLFGNWSDFEPFDAPGNEEIDAGLDSSAAGEVTPIAAAVDEDKPEEEPVKEADMWDMFSDISEPEKEEEEETKKEDNMLSDLDDLFSFDSEEEPAAALAARKFDVNAIMLVEESDPTLASQKKKNTIVKAEMALAKSIEGAYNEGWIDDASVMSLFEADAVQDGMDRYKEAGLILDKMDDVFDEKAGDEAAALYKEFGNFPYQIRCRAVLLAMHDVAEVIA